MPADALPDQRGLARWPLCSEFVAATRCRTRAESQARGKGSPGSEGSVAGFRTPPPLWTRDEAPALGLCATPSASARYVPPVLPLLSIPGFAELTPLACCLHP